jgi:integrase/recombinase XerD
MSTWHKAVEDYVNMRRSLGFKLREAMAILQNFATFLQDNDASHITIALALRWAQQNPAARPVEWAKRLSFVRGFARHWSAQDPATEIPPWRLLPHAAVRPRPYIYSDDEVQRLLTAAQQLPATGGLRGPTYHCLFGLLCVTGLRISEAINLQPEDVDLAEGILTIRGTKFGKFRLVPIHRSTQKVLSDYAARRDLCLAGQPARHFFVSQRGYRLHGADVRRTFYDLSRRTGLRDPSASHGPRLRDFRHRFAIRTLVHWYSSGEDVESRLPILSTYLGHVHLADTYWYLTACPELMGLVVKRLEEREGQS